MYTSSCVILWNYTNGWNPRAQGHRCLQAQVHPRQGLGTVWSVCQAPVFIWHISHSWASRPEGWTRDFYLVNCGTGHEQRNRARYLRKTQKKHTRNQTHACYLCPEKLPCQARRWNFILVAQDHITLGVGAAAVIYLGFEESAREEPDPLIKLYFLQAAKPSSLTSSFQQSPSHILRQHSCALKRVVLGILCLTRLRAGVSWGQLSKNWILYFPRDVRTHVSKIGY